MRICLVPYPVFSDLSRDMIDEIQLYPYLPLGLLTLSTLLEQEGHEVIILDPVWEADTGLLEPSALRNPDRVAQLIKTKAPDLVGFSTICTSYPLVIKWAESFYHLSPKTPIVLGGPQATATDEQTLRAFPWINLVLRGEAESSIIPLVTCLQSGGNLASVPALTWRDGNEILRNLDAPIVTDLDTLPIPAYHLYPMEQLVQRYNARTSPIHFPFPLEAGRGCPFNCSFCSTSSFFQRRYRTKSVGRLIHEIAALHRNYGIERFDLVHDLFTHNNTYILEFCRSLREEGLDKALKWNCNSRTDKINREILAEMAGAGCEGILYGIETGSQRMQRLIGKNLLVQQAKSVIKETLSMGIHVITSFICGFPQEHKEDLSATFTLVMDMVYMRVNAVQLYLLIPLSGSELYLTFGDTLRHDGQWSDLSCRILSQEEQELVLNWPHLFTSFYHYETPHLSYDLLQALSSVCSRYLRFLAALSAKDIDMMLVFDCWPEWYHSHIIPVSEQYYRQSRFLLDFFQFLQEYLNSNEFMTPHLNDMIQYHAIIERVSSVPEDTPIVSERFQSDVLVLIQHLVEGTPLPDEALQPTTYLFWKTNGQVISKRLTPALSELLGIPLA